MRTFPLSLWWFLPAILIGVVQLIPLVGFLFLIISGPLLLLQALCIALGFFGIAHEVKASRLPRVWLLAPLIYFGSYWAYVFLNHIAIYQLHREATAFNADKKITFDRSKTSLLIDTTLQCEKGTCFGTPNYIAETLVKAYRLPVVYESSKDASIPKAHRMGGQDVCSRIKTTEQQSDREFCRYDLAEHPELPVIRVLATWRPISTMLVPEATRRYFTFSTPEGKKIQFQSIEAEPYFLLPLPGFACSFIEKTCQFLFLPRIHFVPPKHENLTVEFIATTLGLQPVTKEARLKEIRSSTAAALDAVDAATALSLERLLSDRRVDLSSVEVERIIERPALFVNRADDIIKALSVARKDSSGNASDLEKILSHLPKPEWMRVAPRAMAVLAENKSRWVFGPLAMRLSDLGPQAVPTLEWIAFGRATSVDFSAILGLCRLGTSASHLSERIAQEVQKKVHRDSRDRGVAFVTLRRFGRSDLAEQMLVGLKSDDREYVLKKYGDTTRSSGPEACAR